MRTFFITGDNHNYFISSFFHYPRLRQQYPTGSAGSIRKIQKIYNFFTASLVSHTVFLPCHLFISYKQIQFLYISVSLHLIVVYQSISLDMSSPDIPAYHSSHCYAESNKLLLYNPHISPSYLKIHTGNIAVDSCILPIHQYFSACLLLN